MSDNTAYLLQSNPKVMDHLVQYNPVWLVAEEILEDDQSTRFNVVFEHHLYGWVNRQYRYDAFNDVLYHKGQTRLSEDEALAIQETDPWIASDATDVPNSYGG